MLKIQSRLPQVGTNIFTVMSKLALEHSAINLSQGFPDYPCSPRLVELVNKYMTAGFNQYAPMAGIEPLREKIAAKVNRLHGSRYAATTDITITAGGTQAIYTALCALIHPGDEVLIFEPAYDCYVPTIELLGGKVRAIELVPPGYTIDWEKVKSCIGPKTRVIMINSPHNPSGSTISAEDITALEEITRGTDIIIVSDEVYEHLIYDNLQHLSMARSPQLRERSLIIASFGKLFHTTGWKMGYCIGPPQLMAEFRKSHQFIVFSVNTPMQYAAAEYLDDEQSYLGLPSFFQQKRDLFARLMENSRFNLLPCSGSYFQAASYATISGENDLDFARRLTIEHKVACIPVSPFYSNFADYKIVRFCFAKKQETLELAATRLSGV